MNRRKDGKRPLYCRRRLCLEQATWTVICLVQKPALYVQEKVGLLSVNMPLKLHVVAPFSPLCGCQFFGTMLYRVVGLLG